MKAREYMEQVRKAERELKLISAKRRHFQEMATSIGVKLTGMPGGGKGASKVENAAVGMVDLLTELDVKEQEYTAMIRKAEELINSLAQEKFRQVLTLYYLAGWSMKSVNDEMDYKDPKSAYRCMKYALGALQGIMDSGE